MTFTINVPVFPMRKEIEARRGRDGALAAPGAGRRRSRDAEGFIEMELLPPEQIRALSRARARTDQIDSL